MESGWDQRQTVLELLAKAEFAGNAEEVWDKLVVQRYQSVTATATFLDYLDFITKNKYYFEMLEDGDDDSDSESEDESLDGVEK